MVLDRFNAKNPHESAEEIMKTAKNVFIHETEIKKIATKLADKTEAEGEFWRVSDHITHPLQYKTDDLPALCQYLFLINSVNFSYWQDPVNGKIEDKFTVDGYATTMGQVASIRKAMDKYDDFTCPERILSITDEEWVEIYKPDDGKPRIPLFETRVRILRENFKILKEKFDGKIWNLLKKAGYSAVDAANLILENFPSFRDEVENYGFFKRVQLLIADIWNHCNAKEFTNFNDVDKLSIFSDYRIPQS